MSEHDEIVDLLAGQVGDGAPVDWDEVMETAGEYERRWIANLRILSEVRRIARSGNLEPAGHMVQPDVTIDVSPASQISAGAFPAWGPLQPLERLGAGGFGAVYRAWDTRLHRQVALKLVGTDAGAGAPPSATPGTTAGLQPDVLPHAIEEARLLARAEHPHIVRIYGVDTHAGCAGIWMEFVQGVTLNDLVAEQGPLAPADVAGIGIDLCNALEAIHAANVIHQDVKPNNVMRESATGRVLLMDFGAGRWRHAANDTRRLSGTPRFTAPEIFSGAPPSPQSDVYGLGALLFFLLTGEAPVLGKTLDEISRRHAAGEIRSLRAMRPELHAPLAAAIDRALAGDRTRRFASAAEFRTALDAARQSLEQPAVIAPDGVQPNTRIAPPAPASRARQLGLTLAAAAVLAGVAFGVRFLRTAALGMTANVQFLEATTGRPFHLDDPITSKDRLEIAIEPVRAAYVYVLNVDGAGKSTVMFPMSGGGTPNPLAGGRVHALPGTNAGAHLGWTFGGDAGAERFLIVASAERLSEFENALANLPAVSLGGGVTARPVGAETVALLTRGVTGVAELPAEPPAPPGAQSLFDLAHRLAGDPKAATRVWIQEMRLVNAGK